MIYINLPCDSLFLLCLIGQNFGIFGSPPTGVRLCIVSVVVVAVVAVEVDVAEVAVDVTSVVEDWKASIIQNVPCISSGLADIARYFPG